MGSHQVAVQWLRGVSQQQLQAMAGIIARAKRRGTRLTRLASFVDGAAYEIGIEYRLSAGSEIEKLGFRVQKLPPKKDVITKVFVTKVSLESWADSSGLTENDAIVEINGRPVEVFDVDGLRAALESRPLE